MIKLVVLQNKWKAFNIVVPLMDELNSIIQWTNTHFDKLGRNSSGILLNFQRSHFVLL